MEQWIITHLGAWAYVLIIFLTGVFTSFGTEATNLTLEAKGKNIHPWWLVLVWSLFWAIILTLLLPSLYDRFIERFVQVTANFIVAIPFYRFAGRFTVDIVFRGYRNKVKKAVGR